MAGSAHGAVSAVAAAAALPFFPIPDEGERRQRDDHDHNGRRQQTASIRRDPFPHTLISSLLLRL